MDDTEHKTALMGLFGELAARELSIRLGRACRLMPRDIRAGSGFMISPEFGLCAHLPLDLSGVRCALLVRETTAGALVDQARQRGVLEGAGREDGKEALQDLLRVVLERPFALLGFLANAPRLLQGCVVQEVDTPSRRKAHQIAFQSQGLIPISFGLEVWGLEGAEVVLLMPGDLLEDAAVGLQDPVNRQEVDSRFLEFAGEIGEEIQGWLDEPDGEDAGKGTQADAPDGEGAGPSAHSTARLGALDSLLADLLANAPQPEADIVLRSPEDLVFAQVFFPGDHFSAYTRKRLGWEITVAPVEMASLPFSRMREEPPGVMATIAYSGAVRAETAFVFPEAGMKRLCQLSGRPANLFVKLLMEPGARAMQALGASVNVTVKAVTPVDFSRMNAAIEGLAVRIRYRMAIPKHDPVEFVQYATMAFLNRMISALVGMDVDLLRVSKRNLMLAFLSLNAAMGARVLEDGALADGFLGPLYGDLYIPASDEDGIFGFCFFESLIELSDRDLRLVLDCPQVRETGPARLACALSAASPELRAKVFRNLSRNRSENVQEHMRRDWRREEVREAQVAVKEMAFVLTLRGRIHPPADIQRQFDWFFYEWDAWQAELAETIRQDFLKLVEQLAPAEISLTLRRAKRTDLLWALQDCDAQMLAVWLRDVSASEREQFLEDIRHLARQKRHPGDTRYQIAHGRQAAIQVAREVIDLREEGGPSQNVDKGSG